MKATPKEVFDGTKPSLAKKIYLIPSFKVGDQVRIKNKKKVFDKEDVLSYLKEIYIVDSIKKNKI